LQNDFSILFLKECANAMMGIPEELAPLIAIAVIEEYVILVTQTAAFVIKDSFILKPKKLAFSIANAVMQPSTV
jgi:hypothetical protein